MKSKLNDKTFRTIELAYKMIYFLFAFFTYCNITFMTPIMSVMVGLVLLLGAVVGVYRLFRVKHFLRLPGLFFAVAFIVSFAISAVSNYRYGYVANFKGLIWMGLHFFTIFACDLERSAEDYKKDFHILSVFYVSITFVMTLASVIQLIMHYGTSTPMLSGYVWGRLWGVFIDPNYGSVFSVTSILFSIYYIRIYPKTWARILLPINIVLQIVYIAYSGSRTALVTMFCCLFAYAVFIGVKKLKFNGFANAALSILMAIVIASASVFVTVETKKVCQGVAQHFQQQAEEPEEPEPDYEEERAQTLESDISNRRFDLWESGVQLFKQKPVFGVSYYNLQSYALAEAPDIYMVNNDYCKFDNTHNMMFNILAAQGILGIAIFAAFMIYAVVYILRRFFKEEGENYEYLSILLLSILSGFVESMFVSDVIYVNSPASVLFWLSLGLLFHYFKTKEKDNKQEKKEELQEQKA